MSILVTGVEQYLGRSIYLFLSQQQYQVIPYTFTSKSSTDLPSLCANSNIVIHAAEVQTLNYIELLLDSLKKDTLLIFCSSADVYGIPITDKVEEKQKRNPISHYGIHKSKIEELVEKYSANNSMIYVAMLRLFLIAGADNTRGIGSLCYDNNNFMLRLMQSFANRNIKFVFYGNDYATIDGYPIRDFIHIIDVCKAIEKIIQSFSPQADIPYIEYNIGSGEGYSLSDIVNRASEVLQMPIKTTVKNRKEDEVARLVADISRPKLLLDWTPRYPIEQLILTTWQWYLKNI